MNHIKITNENYYNGDNNLIEWVKQNNFISPIE